MVFRSSARLYFGGCRSRALAAQFLHQISSTTYFCSVQQNSECECASETKNDDRPPGVHCTCREDARQQFDRVPEMVPSTSPNGFAGVPPLSAARRRLDESRASAAAGAKHIQAMPRACADAAIKAGAKWMYGKLRDVKAEAPGESAPLQGQRALSAKAARIAVQTKPVIVSAL